MNTHTFVRYLEGKYSDSLLLPDIAKHADGLFHLLRECFNIQKEEARKEGKATFSFLGVWKHSMSQDNLLCSMVPDHTTRLMCQKLVEDPQDGYVRLINIVAKPPMYLDYLDNIQKLALEKPKLHPVVLQYKPDLSVLFQLVFVNIFELMLIDGVEIFTADGLGVFNLINVKHGQAITLTLGD